MDRLDGRLINSLRDTLADVPKPYVMTEVEDKLIQAILDLLNTNGLTACQAKALVGRLSQLIDIGELLSRNTSH